MKLFSGEFMDIVLSDGKVINSTLPIPNNLSLEQINEALNKYNNRTNRDYIFESWKSILRRCHYNSMVDNEGYKDKGIFICQDWLYNFEHFYIWSIEHGHTPESTIDRIDVTGNYTPMNCQWVSRSENTKRQQLDYFYKGGCQG